MSSMMHAKVQVTRVELHPGGEKLVMAPVARSNGYPPGGSDGDNTFAKYSPSGEFQLFITNPALHGVFKPGQKYYVDFTSAE